MENRGSSRFLIETLRLIGQTQSESMQTCQLWLFYDNPGVRSVKNKEWVGLTDTTDRNQKCYIYSACVQLEILRQWGHLLPI